jgi:hypothetical protein
VTAATKCTVRDGLFVQPCKSLEEMTEIGNPPSGKSRGIYWWQLSNLKTHKPSRSFFGAKSTGMPKGMAFNFCPWCGTNISAPFMQDAQNRKRQSGAQKQDQPESVSTLSLKEADTSKRDSKESGNA